MDIKGIIKNLEEIINVESKELVNEIICAFEDYKYEGEEDVIVSSPNQMNCFIPCEGIHNAYINHEDSPIIEFELEETDNDIYSIIKACE